MANKLVVKQRYSPCGFTLPRTELEQLKALAALEQVSLSVMCERIISARLQKEAKTINAFQRLQAEHASKAVR